MLAKLSVQHSFEGGKTALHTSEPKITFRFSRKARCCCSNIFNRPTPHQRETANGHCSSEHPATFSPTIARKAKLCKSVPVSLHFQTTSQLSKAEGHTRGVSLVASEHCPPKCWSVAFNLRACVKGEQTGRNPALPLPSPLFPLPKQLLRSISEKLVSHTVPLDERGPGNPPFRKEGVTVPLRCPPNHRAPS